MIKSKKEYLYYRNRDKLALGIKKNRPSFFSDEIWKFEIELRRGEYLINCKPILWRIRYGISRFRKHKLALKCGGYAIPYNIFEEGLAIVHWGSIVVSSGAKVGKNCRIHEGVTIGATNGSVLAANIGNNCFIGSGAKIIGEVEIGDNVAIGAGAVVVKNVESNITVAGVPAKKVSDNNSSKNIHSVLV